MRSHRTIHFLLIAAFFLPVFSAAGAENGRRVNKTYEDPIEQSEDAARIKMESLKTRAANAGPEGAGALGEVEGALGRLSGAVSEHKTIYVKYKKESREPDREGPEKRNPRLKALAEQLSAAFDKYVEAQNAFDVAYQKASRSISDSAAKKKLTEQGDVFSSNTEQPGTTPQNQPGTQPTSDYNGPGTSPANPLRGGVSESGPPPGPGQSTGGRQTTTDLSGKVVGGGPEQGLSAGPYQSLPPNYGNQGPGSTPTPPHTPANKAGSVLAGDTPRPAGRDPRYKTLEPIRDNTPLGDNTKPLQGRVEKDAPSLPGGQSSSSTDTDANPRGKISAPPDNPPTVLKGRVEDFDPTMRRDSPLTHHPIPPSNQGTPTPAPTLQGNANKNQDDDFNPPTFAGQRERHREFAPTRKKKENWGVGFQRQFQGSAYSQKVGDGRGEVSVLTGGLQVGVQATKEGFEGKAEIELTGRRDKVNIFKGRLASATIQTDLLTAKAGVSATLKSGPQGLDGKVSAGGEAKLVEVQGSGQWTLPLSPDMGIQFGAQASAGIGAAASVEATVDSTHGGFHAAVSEKIGLGPMEKFGFSIDLVKLKPYQTAPRRTR